MGSGFKRLKQGKTLIEIIKYLIESHPDGLKRSEIQVKLKERLGIGESTGGVNRHLKKLREGALIDWDQESFTYVLPPDWDSKEFFIRVVESLSLSTDKCYFLFLDLKPILSEQSMLEVDDYIGHRYDTEMNENLMALHADYKMNEITVFDDVNKLLAHHNAYVRLRLFRTLNECFLNDLSKLPASDDRADLMNGYSRNIDSIDNEMKNERETIFTLREEIIKYLKEKRLSSRLKFLIRFSLNHVRPSHVYDNMI